MDFTDDMLRILAAEFANMARVKDPEELMEILLLTQGARLALLESAEDIDLMRYTTLFFEIYKRFSQEIEDEMEHRGIRDQTLH